MKKIDINALQQYKMTRSMSGKFALLDNIDIFTSNMDSLLLDGFMIAFVNNGSIQLKVDDTLYNLNKGDIIALHPHSIVENIKTDKDINMRAFYSTIEYAHMVGNIIELNWTSEQLMSISHHSLHVDDEDLELLNLHFDLLHTINLRPNSPQKWRSLQHAFSSLIFDYDFMQNKESNDMPQRKYSQSENLMTRFLKLLNDPSHPFVSTSQYAEELCVTPKYFSSVCKQTTGKTAYTLINEKIIKTAKILLRNDNLSIKQVSDELNFANQSHFGRFFVRHVGISPLQYREAQNKDNIGIAHPMPDTEDM